MKVACLDANIEFIYRRCTREMVNRGQELAERRLVHLNRKKRLDYAEMAEYNLVVRAIHGKQRLEGAGGRICLPRTQVNLKTSQEKLRALYCVLPLASFPYFPETLSVESAAMYIRHRSSFDPYSTGDILRSIHSDGLLSGFFEDLLHPILKREPPLLVGISVAFPSQVIPAFRCAHVIKKKLPQAHVAMGGAFVSWCMRDVTEPKVFDVIDSLVLDEGEIPLERLAEEVSIPNPDLRKVPGLVYRVGGKILRNTPPLLMDQGSLPPPDYLALDLDRYLVPRDAVWLPFRLSRGCPWARCAFCRTGLRMVCEHQQPPVDVMYEKIRDVVRQTGVNRIAFTDDASTPDVLEELSRKIVKDRFFLLWGVNLRFEPGVTLERCVLYRQAGCTRINFGLETYNDRLLRLTRKGANTKTIRRVLANIGWVGIHTLVYMMIGLPTETEEEALRSFAAIEQFRKDGLISSFNYNIFHILPDSAIGNHPEKYGITRLITSKGRDLEGAIANFESTGMPRLAAAHLSIRFAEPHRDPIREVKIDRGKVRLNYDLGELESALASNPHFELPYGLFLRQGKRCVAPVKRRRMWG